MFERYVKTIGGYACLLVVLGSCFSIAFEHVGFGAALACSLVFSALTRARDWRKYIPGKTVPFYILFVCVCFAAILLSGDPGTGIKNFSTTLFLLTAPLAFIPFALNQPVRKFSLPLLAASVAAGLAIVLVKAANADFDSTVRFAPYMGLMNYGGALEIVLPAVLAVLFHAERTGNKKLGSALMVLIFLTTTAVLYNGTRIAWLSAAVTALVLFAVNIRQVLTRRFIIFLVCLAAYTALFFVQHQSYFRRLASIAALPEVETAAKQPPAPTAVPKPSKPKEQTAVPKPPAPKEKPARAAAAPARKTPTDVDRITYASNAVRLVFWRAAAGRIAEAPWFGAGFTGVSMPILSDGPPFRVVGHGEKVRHNVHNIFFQIGMDAGLLGLFSFLLIALPSLRLAFANLLSPSSRSRLWAHILLTALLAMAVNGLTDNVLEIKSMMYVFGCAVALAWVNLAAIANSRPGPDRFPPGTPENDADPGTPLFSVIVTTCNRAALLPGAVESVRRQTFPDFELVVVDDGSADDTHTVVESILGTGAFPEGRAHAYRTGGTPKGVSAARNLGISRAKGTYVLFLDDDDRLDASFLAETHRCIRNAPRPPDALCAGKKRLTERDGKIIETRDDFIARPCLDDENTDAAIGLEVTMRSGMGGVVVARQALIDAGLFDERLNCSEDLDLFMTLLENGAAWVTLEECLVEVHVHPGPRLSSGAGHAYYADCFRIVIDKHRALLERLPVLREKCLCDLAIHLFKSGQADEGKKTLLSLLKKRPWSPALWELCLRFIARPAMKRFLRLG